MKFLKNRIFLSALCLLLAAGVAFFLLPRFYEDKSATVTVLRAAQDIPAGTTITEQMLSSAEVGGYGLPEGIITDKMQLVGKVAQTDLVQGDYFFPQKVGNYLAV